MMRGFLMMMFSILAIPCLSQEINKDYTVSWIGNSFSGSSKWVQQDIEDIYVTQDGTVYTIIF